MFRFITSLFSSEKRLNTTLFPLSFEDDGNIVMQNGFPFDMQITYWNNMTGPQILKTWSSNSFNMNVFKKVSKLSIDGELETISALRKQWERYSKIKMRLEKNASKVSKDDITFCTRFSNNIINLASTSIRLNFFTLSEEDMTDCNDRELRVISVCFTHFDRHCNLPTRGVFSIIMTKALFKNYLPLHRRFSKFMRILGEVFFAISLNPSLSRNSGSQDNTRFLECVDRYVNLFYKNIIGIFLYPQLSDFNQNYEYNIKFKKIFESLNIFGKDVENGTAIEKKKKINFISYCIFFHLMYHSTVVLHSDDTLVHELLSLLQIFEFNRIDDYYTQPLISKQYIPGLPLQGCVANSIEDFPSFSLFLSMFPVVVIDLNTFNVFKTQFFYDTEPWHVVTNRITHSVVEHLASVDLSADYAPKIVEDSFQLVAGKISLRKCNLRFEITMFQDVFDVYSGLFEDKDIDIDRYEAEVQYFTNYLKQKIVYIWRKTMLYKQIKLNVKKNFKDESRGFIQEQVNSTALKFGFSPDFFEFFDNMTDFLFTNNDFIDELNEKSEILSLESELNAFF
ncbi:hypothetical protein PCE1_003482 [Barthelona sp. PCE]